MAQNKIRVRLKSYDATIIDAEHRRLLRPLRETEAR